MAFNSRRADLTAKAVDDILNELLAGHTIADSLGLVLNDWQDGGRLDLLLDAIPTTAMRGTDSALTAIINNIQRGTISLSSVSSNTATISSVNTAKSFVMHDGQRGTVTVVDQMHIHVVLTSGTVVTATRGDATGTAIVAFEVIEYK